MKNKISKTFCVHPWVNLLVNSSGTYNFCCIATTGAKSQITNDNNDIKMKEQPQKKIEKTIITIPATIDDESDKSSNK